MQAILAKEETKSVRELIEFISSAGRNIYIDEFFEHEFDLCVYHDHILVVCHENICKLTLHNRFVDASSLTLMPK